MSTKPSNVQSFSGHAHAGQAPRASIWSFIMLFTLIMFLSTSVAAALDILPEPSDAVADSSQKLAASPLVAVTAPELPTKIEIPEINLEQKVNNPESTNVALLDQALHSGVVRYPSSSKLGAAGNVIIFGHSSYLPIVNNPSFKAFNGIQKLEEGDRIMVTGTSHVYVYAVETVKKESTTQDAIPLSVDGSKLTLATCDSFGEKTDRFVVTATLVETRAL